MIMENKYNIGEIPFYYTALSTPFNPTDLPNKLQFVLKQDDNGLVRQIESEQEQDYLCLAYQMGSQISGLMDDTGIGKLYASDFITYICKKEGNIAGKKILEIGCGTGYLLYELQKLGADVFGIEPGAYGIEGQKKYGIPILIDFFDSNKITDSYDIIIFYGVLEHISDAKKFLEDVKSVLKTNGKIFLSVPDCEPYLQVGDISLLIHEHWNYFTKDTLESLALNCGLMGDIIRSEFAGALYACFVLGERLHNTNPINYNLLADYINKIEVQKEKLFKYMEEIMLNQTLGIYVPGRMINILSICYTEVPHQIRFFDDNANLHNKYFPGIDIKVEDFKDFTNNPVDVMLIASFTFGANIREKIIESGIRCETVLFEELLL